MESDLQPGFIYTYRDPFLATRSMIYCGYLLLTLSYQAQAQPFLGSQLREFELLLSHMLALYPLLRLLIVPQIANSISSLPLLDQPKFFKENNAKWLRFTSVVLNRRLGKQLHTNKEACCIVFILVSKFFHSVIHRHAFTLDISYSLP